MAQRHREQTRPAGLRRGWGLGEGSLRRERLRGKRWGRGEEGSGEAAGETSRRWR